MSDYVEDVHDIHSLLTSSERDYLVRNNGDQVAVSSLNGKTLGLYFSAFWGHPFTPNLVDVYNELLLVVKVGDFEIVFISADDGGEYEYEESFYHRNFSDMPWLAVPFSDSKTRRALMECFKVMGVPHLVFLDQSGNLISEIGVDLIEAYGAEGYPFTPEWIRGFKQQEEEARMNPSLRSILESPSRDFIITANRNKVPVAELEGKTVGLYFIRVSIYELTSDYTDTLVKVYNELKAAKEDNFEIVMIPLYSDEESFNKELSNVPWFSLPFKDKQCWRLVQYFELSIFPAVVIIDS